MSDLTSSKLNISSIVFRTATAATVLILGVFIVFMCFEVCTTKYFFVEECVSKWSYLRSAPPNEIGDTLAGVAGALAFVWVAASVVIQRLELDRTVNAFVEQGAILREQSDRDAFDSFVENLADKARHRKFRINFDRPNNIMPPTIPLVHEMGSEFRKNASSAVIANTVAEQVAHSVEKILKEAYNLTQDGSAERLQELADYLSETSLKSERWQADIQAEFKRQGYKHLEESVKKLCARYIHE
ncbi:hypothetical protein [Ruegeria sp. HKCCE3926]|uniref:hypothetical protein n=1 Tax=Ruegeria sp. HKCCE3926 TaxID=2794831 RepID=UPI001AE28890|nr:hypothetical protein [Ruegeria sp. HKCCE3926]